MKVPPSIERNQHARPRAREVPADVQKAAQMFETLFVEQVFKEMRQNPDGGENPFRLENGATKIYQSMVDSENAEKIARRSALGIADLFIESVMRERYHNNQGAHRGPRTGVREGSHEGTEHDQSGHKGLKLERGSRGNSPESEDPAL